MEIAIVYMVAGLSSRFGGKIKQFAKVTEDKTLIEYSLDQAINSGISKIIFIVGEKTEKPFKEMFGENYKGLPIFYVKQTYDENKRDKPWGTADAIVQAKQYLDCPFIICNGDDIYGENSFKILFNELKNKNNLTLGYKIKNVLSEHGGVNRGIFELDENNNIKTITETFDITPENLDEKGLNEDSLCSMNIFALYPEVLDFLEEKVNKFKQRNEGDREKECLLPKEFTDLIKEDKISIKVLPTDEDWYGVTRPGDELKIREKLG